MLLVTDKIKFCIYSVAYLIIAAGYMRTVPFLEQIERLLLISIIFLGGDTLVFISSLALHH